MLHLGDMKDHPRFAILRDAVERAGSDATWMFGGTHDGGYHIQQNPDEFAALLCLLLNRCRPIGLYGEIGVAAGGTTRLMHESVGFEEAVLIDDGNHPKHKHFPANMVNVFDPYHLLVGDSHRDACAEQLKDILRDEKFDVVFIDGDHSYEGVKQDIELVRPYCTPATLLIFHDTAACPGVKQAWDELPHKVAEFIGTDRQLGIGVAHNG